MGLDVMFWGTIALTLIWCLSGAYDWERRVWRENFKSKDTMIFKDEDEREGKEDLAPRP